MDNIGEVNFDHPDAFDFDDALKVLKDLRDGKSVEIPNYSFVENARYHLCSNL